MKLESGIGTVTVTLTDEEAYAIFNFTDYAVRKNINWSWEGDGEQRFLHHEIVGGDDTLGLKETRKLSKKLGKVFGWN